MPLPLDKVIAIYPAFELYADDYAMQAAKFSPNSEIAFLAQCAHESYEFKIVEENLNYSADSLAAVWPTRYALVDENNKLLRGPAGKNLPNATALKIARKPEVIANKTYANRYGNGNEKSGDGWKFRGRGLRQLTFRDNYARCGDECFHDKEFLLDQPEFLTTSQGAVYSAIWFWNSNKLSALANNGTLSAYTEITKKINGGLIGHDQRVKVLQKLNTALDFPAWE